MKEIFFFVLRIFNIFRTFTQANFSTRLLIIIVALSFPSNTFSYEFEGREYRYDMELSISFKNKMFSYINWEYEAYHEDSLNSLIPVTMRGSYTIKSVYGFTVAEVIFQKEKREIFIFYEGKHIMIYDTKLQKTLYGSETRHDEAWLFPLTQVTSTSSLTEVIGGKEIRYPPENLTDMDITKPWVEGAVGNGIGEKLKIGRYEWGIKDLLILNGFFSPTKPSLYYANSRVKSLMMRGYNSEGLLIYEGIKELADTPNLQLISSIIPLVEIELEILDVYPGLTYEDTAISGIFTDAYRHLMDIIQRTRKGD